MASNMWRWCRGGPSRFPPSSVRSARRWWRRAPRAAPSSCSSFRPRELPGEGGGPRGARPRARRVGVLRGVVRRVLGVLVMSALVIVTTVPSAAIDALRVCADPDNLPFSAATGATRGFYVDVAELVAARLGARTEYTWWHTSYGQRALRNTLFADR